MWPVGSLASLRLRLQQYETDKREWRRAADTYRAQLSLLREQLYALISAVAITCSQPTCGSS
jgi:hypothetical protein